LLPNTNILLFSLYIPIPARGISHTVPPEAAIEFAEASLFGNFLGHLPAELHTAAREEITRELEQFRTPEGIRREGARIIAVALKP
jgi:arsenite methyltransferase